MNLVKNALHSTGADIIARKAWQFIARQVAPTLLASPTDDAPSMAASCARSHDSVGKIGIDQLNQATNEGKRHMKQQNEQKRFQNVGVPVEFLV